MWFRAKCVMKDGKEHYLEVDAKNWNHAIGKFVNSYPDIVTIKYVNAI